MMETMSFQIPQELKKSLIKLSEHEDRSSSYIIRQALSEYLQDHLDLIEAEKRYKEYVLSGESTSWEEIKKENDLED